jgi:hypothetical protein
MRTYLVTALAATALILLIPASAEAQHMHGRRQVDSTDYADSAMMRGMQHGAMTMTLGLPMSRMGSGTSWLPDASPMHAAHYEAGRWGLMLHGQAFGMYDKQFSDRGGDQISSPNWVMLMATRPLAGGFLQLRGMFSAEPLTVGARGYPLLLQSGEAFKGEPLHDRQHPHDLFMELAALYERPVARNLAISLYAAPVGEPALGPVAFPHRPSAAGDPLAPLSHHWQDATHISFGVLTAGVFTRTMKLEASLFNGREPDEHRYNFDYAGRSLDSWAGRLTVNPGTSWSLSASYGFLKSPEELSPDESQHRFTAAVLHSRPVGDGGNWSSALIYGANKHAGGDWEGSVTAETNVAFDRRNEVFARVNFVRKSAEDLVVGTDPEKEFSLGGLVLGYVRELMEVKGVSLGAGVRGALNVIPEELEPAYGTRTPTGFAVYLRLRPAPMRMDNGMEGMDHRKMKVMP